MFIPNYYRGAYQQFPRTAGRSSQLFNTGTVHWIYRCLIDGLFGVKGVRNGLKICPQLPDSWAEVSVNRTFRGAEFAVEILRVEGISRTEVEVDGELIDGDVIRNIQADKKYRVRVRVPVYI